MRRARVSADLGPPVFLGLDPSLTATGYAVIGCDREIHAAGVIVTAPPKGEERKRQTASEALGRRGLFLYQSVVRLFYRYRIVAVAQEGAAGSKSAVAAAALARAQQACFDAVYTALRTEPMILTVQQVKKAATGRMNATKDEIEHAMRRAWGGAGFDRALAEPAPFASRPPPRGVHENAYDAAAVLHAAWDLPALAALRVIGG